LSFGPKLDQLPAASSPNEEVIVTLEFAPNALEFEREATIYVEEPNGIRTLKITVQSAPRESES
jgi:hypothetical protein